MYVFLASLHASMDVSRCDRFRKEEEEEYESFYTHSTLRTQVARAQLIRFFLIFAISSPTGVLY